MRMRKAPFRLVEYTGLFANRPMIVGRKNYPSKHSIRFANCETYSSQLD